MARELRAPVWVSGRWFRPGDQVPAEYADQIGDHAWINDGQEQPAGPTPPPLGGIGSSTEAWSEYATSLGVPIPEDAKRDDIVDAIRDAGHPVE